MFKRGMDQRRMWKALLINILTKAITSVTHATKTCVRKRSARQLVSKHLRKKQKSLLEHSFRLFSENIIFIWEVLIDSRNCRLARYLRITRVFCEPGWSMDGDTVFLFRALACYHIPR